jgi:DNA end-binding protein Ku
MPRSIWKGSLSFGLVNVPVGLYPATSDKTLHFHQVEDGTSDRIRYKKVNERTGREVPADRIVKAMDTGHDEYVIVSDEELEEAEPEKSRTIDIDGFVDLADIDPVYFRTAYYLAPKSEAGTKAYQLLRDAMQKAGKVGIASFVMRGKEYLVAIRSEGDVLVLETLYFADEIRDAEAELPHLTEKTQVKPKERDMALTLINSLGEKWNPADYHDSYREHVQALLKEKEAGHEVVRHAEPERGGKVIDLLEALQASVKTAGTTSARATQSGSAKRPTGRKKSGQSKKADPSKAATEKSKKKTKSARTSKKPSSSSGNRRRAS